MKKLKSATHLTELLQVRLGFGPESAFTRCLSIYMISEV